MHKITVGICDDDSKWSEKAKKLILNYGKKTSTVIEVFCFAGKEDLESYQGEPLEVLFMDISLKEESGIELASDACKKWKKCQIVYLSNYIYYATEVYKTPHIYFVLKEQFEDRIGDVFLKVFHALEQTRTALVFSVIGNKEISFAPEDILYFERNKRITYVYTVWGTYEMWDKLDEIMEVLPKIDFVRCHNSYIVSLPAVKEMMKGYFILKDGSKIMISRSHSRSVKAAFMKWALTQIS